MPCKAADFALLLAFLINRPGKSNQISDGLFQRNDSVDAWVNRPNITRNVSLVVPVTCTTHRPPPTHHGTAPLPDTRPPVLDEIDRQLIAALQINARESVAMLARQLGIARTTVTSRLARLEKAKVITGYGVRLGQRVVDGGLQAYVGIKVQPRSGKEVVRRLSAMAQVQQLCAVSGEFDYVAWLRTDSPEQLDQLLDQIGSVDGVEKTTTSIILSSKIDRGQPV
jgi:DNA-binding Lrp family transcriptional regulator